jgi:hypothetical protein
MSRKFDNLIENLKSESIRLELDLSEELLIETAEELGVSIYGEDSQYVDSSSSDELLTVKNEFLIKKLNLTDGPVLDEAIMEVLEQLKDLKNKKHRVLVYALLKKKLSK